MKWLLLASGIALGMGVIVHELIHYVVATQWASSASMEWHGRPEVHYETEQRQVARAVNLAPTVTGLTLTIAVVVFASISFIELLFIIGLAAPSKEDLSLSAARV